MNKIIVLVWLSFCTGIMIAQSPGSLDISFDGDGKLTSSIDQFNNNFLVNDMLIQRDGKILIIGSNYNGQKYEFALVRYNLDGSFDSSFGNGGKVITTFITGDAIAYAATIDVDDKITVVGTSNGGTLSSNFFAIARFFPNGAPDNNFSSDGILNSVIGDGNDIATAVDIQADKKIVIAGLASDVSGTTTAIGIGRYFPTGAFDRDFDEDGKVVTTIGFFNDVASSVLILESGKILVGGSSSNETGDESAFSLVKYNQNGSLDNTFGDSGVVKVWIGKGNASIQDIIELKNHTIIAVGNSTDSLGKGFFTMVRFLQDGTIDSTFGRDGLVVTSLGTTYSGAVSVAVQSDDKILMAGWAEFDTLVDFALARYNANGSIDRSFSGDGLVTTAFERTLDFGKSVKMQNDGKIVVGGHSLNDIGDKSTISIARYFSGLMVDVNEVQENYFKAKIHPNPIEGKFIISYTLPVSQQVTFTLWDIYGARIAELKSKHFQSSGNYQEEISLPSGITNGNYIFQISGESYQANIPIINAGK